jgi:hypothetical protein
MTSKKKKDSSETAIPSAKVGRPTAYYAVEDVVKMVRNSCLAGIAKVNMVEWQMAWEKIECCRSNQNIPTAISY